MKRYLRRRYKKKMGSYIDTRIQLMNCIIVGVFEMYPRPAWKFSKPQKGRGFYIMWITCQVLMGAVNAESFSGGSVAAYRDLTNTYAGKKGRTSDSFVWALSDGFGRRYLLLTRPICGRQRMGKFHLWLFLRKECQRNCSKNSSRPSKS